jgi:outer membrane receptor protein involved in Fe transport
MPINQYPDRRSASGGFCERKMPRNSRSMLLRAAVALNLLPLVAVADDSTSAAGGGAALEVITVTAQKVSADLQKTAAAITAISGDELLADTTSAPCRT